jgi:hypothetical protein
VGELYIIEGLLAETRRDIRAHRFREGKMQGKDEEKSSKASFAFSTLIALGYRSS